MLTHLSLFSGIGGIDLAAEAAGFRTVGQVERDGYCRRVLERHWPGVPRFGDVRDVTADALRDAGIERPLLLSGGFPCQPFSCAGKRRGAADDRFLWPEMCRIVSECRPPWVLGENVAGFVGMALDDCAADLERLGYAVRAFVVPAAGVGAPHRRERCFVLAHADREREQQQKGPVDAVGRRPRDGGPTLADAEGPGLATRRIPGGPSPAFARPERGRAAVPDADHAVGPLHRPPGRVGRAAEPVSWDGGGWWAAEPRVGRVADGVPRRVDRLRSLGNAVVPAQVYPFVRAIADLETGAISC